MKKSYKYLIGAGISCMPFFALAGALPAGRPDPVYIAVNNIITVAKVLVEIVFAFALVMFGWGIVKLISAAGDPGAIKTAKGYIIWGVIGMAVLASLTGLITYLQMYFGVKSGGGTIQTPKFGI